MEGVQGGRGTRPVHVLFQNNRNSTDCASWRVNKTRPEKFDLATRESISIPRPTVIIAGRTHRGTSDGEEGFLEGFPFCISLAGEIPPSTDGNLFWLP